MLEKYRVDTFLEKLEIDNSPIWAKIVELRNKGILFNLDEGPWVAGGSVLKMVLNEPLGTSDIDIFCSTKEQEEKICSILDNLRFLGGKKHKYRSANANSFSVDLLDEEVKVQVIRRNFFKTVYEVLGTFDITAAQWATDGVELVFPPQTIKDVNDLTFRYNKFDLENSVVNRMFKYLNKGYKMDIQTLTMVCDVVHHNAEHVKMREEY